MKLHDIVRWLDDFLETGKIQDFPGAHNGLQLENGGEVTRVAAAVDACEAVISQAVFWGCDLLVVHHGLFWNGSAPITGRMHRKIKAALQGGMAIYSAHLPLDVHPTVGNNAVLARLIGMPEKRTPFLEMGGAFAGIHAAWEIPLPELLARVEEATGNLPHHAPGGPPTTRRVGLATGCAGQEILAAAKTGIDTFITGEGPHWTYPLAEELGVNLVYAGHYATETFGVRALAEEMQRVHGLPWEFIDHPTGL